MKIFKSIKTKKIAYINVPEELDEYVNDVKINVFEIAWLPDRVIEKFSSDFKIVAKFFSEKRKNADYVPNDKTTIKHVDAILKLLSAMTGDHRYEEILKVNSGKEVRNMCDVAERLEQKGKTEERLIIFLDLIKDGTLSIEKASEKSGIPIEILKEHLSK